MTHVSSVNGVVYERRGSGSPLVLLHGVGHRWEGWLPVIDKLATEHDVIALDYPGFGASPGLPDGMTYDVPTAVELLKRFFAELGLDRPHVAGNSLGGMFALRLALDGAVSSATALSPAGFFGRGGWLWASNVLRVLRFSAGSPGFAMRRLAAAPARRRLMFGAIYGHPERIAADVLLADARALHDSVGYRPTMRSGAHLGETTFRRPAVDCPVPVTIAWGDRDRLLPPHAQARRAHEMFPTARMVRLPDCGHVPMGDDPDLVARAILQGAAA